MEENSRECRRDERERERERKAYMVTVTSTTALAQKLVSNGGTFSNGMVSDNSPKSTSKQCGMLKR